MRKKWKKYLPLYLMAVPGLLYIIINNYMPMFGLVMAFKNLNFKLGILKSPWAGLQNFEFLFRTRDAYVITRNTLLYNLGFIVIGTISSVVVAILINEIRSKVMSRIYQSIILIPYLMSWVVVGYLAFAFLSSDTGFINRAILSPLGKDPVSWYTQKQYWPVILTFVNQWKGIGFTMVIYLAAIVGISRDYYEAAKIDGAGKLAQIRYITLPLLKPTIITMVLMSIGRI